MGCAGSLIGVDFAMVRFRQGAPSQSPRRQMYQTVVPSLSQT